MKSLKIGFSSSWNVLDPKGELFQFLRGLMEKYVFEITPAEEADYFFFTVFNGAHHSEARPDAIKIFFTGENYCPDFNVCDYAISFEYLNYGERHLRYPLYLFYPELDSLSQRPILSAADLKARSHFCNFIVSNSNFAEPERDAFFQALNARIPVHSAGRHLRNTAGFDDLYPEIDANARKRRFMQDFRFSLTFENSSHPGYVTEKMVDAFIARTVPIYWGDPRIADEFNPASFVNIHSFADREAALDHIVTLNGDKEAVLSMLNATPLKSPDQIQSYHQKLQAFLENIFSQPLQEARRRPRSGFSALIERRRRRDQTGYRKWFKRNRI